MIQQNVGGLDVPVHHVFGVHVSQRVTDGDQDVDGARQRHRRIPHLAGQIGPVNEVRDDVGQTAGQGSHVMHGNNRGMIQLCQGPSFIGVVCQGLSR